MKKMYRYVSKLPRHDIEQILIRGRHWDSSRKIVGKMQGDYFEMAYWPGVRYIRGFSGETSAVFFSGTASKSGDDTVFEGKYHTSSVSRLTSLILLRIVPASIILLYLIIAPFKNIPLLIFIFLACITLNLMLYMRAKDDIKYLVEFLQKELQAKPFFD